MNKNTLIGFVLMALVMFGFMAYENHNRAIQAEEIRIQDSIAAIEAQKERLLRLAIAERTTNRHSASVSECR